MRERILRALAVALIAVVGFLPRTASAYPWLIRHDYTVCVVCHTDPSGANLLTAYGRSLSQSLLSTELAVKADEEAGAIKDFAFGAVPLPENVQLGAFWRQGYIQNLNTDLQRIDKRPLTMRIDLEAYAKFGNFSFNVLGGVLPSESANGGREALMLTREPGDVAYVARTYWAGMDMQDGDAILRAGRMNLPFGLRNPEHNAWVRSETRTDYNQQQQHGISYYWGNGTYRVEGMLVEGNLQMHPEKFRERGFVGYVERRFEGGQSLALQAQALHSQTSLLAADGGGLTRQSYGAFYRLVPHETIAIMAEANLLVNTFDSETKWGNVAFVQGDWELFRGGHMMVTLEEKKSALAGADRMYGAWLSGVIFPVSHLELRADSIYRKAEHGGDPSITILFQGLVYL
jgi:hypothetical protein